MRAWEFAATSSHMEGLGGNGMSLLLLASVRELSREL